MSVDMIERIKKCCKKYREQLCYIFFGGLTTVVNWVVYTGVLLCFSLSIEFSNIIAWVVAVLFAYFTNKMYVFKSKQESINAIVKEFILFIGSRIATGIVEIVGVPLLYYLGLSQAVFGVEGFLAKIIISIFIIFLNYIFSKIVVFKKRIY